MRRGRVWGHEVRECRRRFSALFVQVLVIGSDAGDQLRRIQSGFLTQEILRPVGIINMSASAKMPEFCCMNTTFSKVERQFRAETAARHMLLRHTQARAMRDLLEQCLRYRMFRKWQ